MKTQDKGNLETVIGFSQRIDKWLWYARLVKTRSQASRLIAAGKVRVNRKRVTKPAGHVRENDVITAVIHHKVRVVEVLQAGRRRGPASEAESLYKDLTPKPAEAETEKSKVHSQASTREKGKGRPTKRERRKLELFLKVSGGEEWR